MNTLSERVWYGTAQLREGERVNLRRPAIALLILALLVGGRLLIGFAPHPSMEVYRETTWALLNEHNWGRQCLVGVLQYPPVPTVALVILTALRNYLAMISPLLGSFDPGHLMVAVCQVWVFVYLVRLADLYHSRKLRYALAILLMLAVLVGPSAMEANPYWVYLVILGSIVFHLCRWEVNHSLRDLVVVALNCGLLIFGGFLGIVFSLLILGTLWLRGNPSVIHREGGLTLLCLPVLYCLCLYPLFNWLIMGDPFFWLKHFIDSLNVRSLADLPSLADPGIVQLWGIMSLLCIVLMLLPRVPLYARVAFNLAWGCALAGMIRSGGQAYLGGEYLLAGFVIVPLLLFFLYYEDSAVKRVTTTLGLMGLIVFAIAAVVQIRGTARGIEQFGKLHPPPTAAALANLADLEWKDSRIMIYDLRTAVIFCRQQPERFWAKLDFDEGYLRDTLKTEEQLHLLVPPDNGQFYAHARSPLANIHAENRSWLMLVKQWEGGWQLYRCVRPRPLEP